jgi:hypothetical protein
MAFSFASQIISFLLVGFCRKKHIHIFQYLPIKASYFMHVLNKAICHQFWFEHYMNKKFIKQILKNILQQFTHNGTSPDVEFMSSITDTYTITKHKEKRRR